MAKIIKSGKTFKVVNSVNGVVVKGGSRLKTLKKARKVKCEVLKRNGFKCRKS